MEPAPSFSDLNLMQAHSGATHIMGMDEYGFNVNGVFLRGSVICTPTASMLWDCQTAKDITTSKLAVIAAVKPRIEFLLIGTGDAMDFVDVSVYPFFQRRGIAVECMSTVHAMATFNVLNSEGRSVAAALLSQSPMTRDDMCAYSSGLPPSEA